MTDYNPIVLNNLSSEQKKILMEGTTEEKEKVMQQYYTSTHWVKAEYLGNARFKPILSNTDGFLQAVPLKLYIFSFNNNEVYDNQTWEEKVIAESETEAICLLTQHYTAKGNQRDIDDYYAGIKEYEIKKGVIE